MSNIYGSKFWVALVDHFWAEKVFECNTMTAPLYLADVFYLRQKKYGCKIIHIWTDCESKLDQQCK